MFKAGQALKREQNEILAWGIAPRISYQQPEVTLHVGWSRQIRLGNENPHWEHNQAISTEDPI